MREIEIIEKRKPKEKHFLREDGTMKAIVYSEDIHYLKNGKYEEIDNSIIEEENYYRNRSNSYEVRFGKNKKNLIEINKDGYYLKINLINNKLNKIDINKSEFKCKNILSYVDIDYKVLNNKLKESIILKNKKSNRKILFTIDTNLDLILIDKNIIAKKEEKEYFKIDAPYMIDSNNIENHNISYKLDKINNKYYLELLLDEEWLNNAKYPVIIDPTITNLGNNNSVYDTYIYPGDTNVDRNSLNYIKIGVEKENDTLIPNRALIKFDLPEIATGDQIVKAYINLNGWATTNSLNSFYPIIYSIHSITSNWTESTANWNTMHDKFENRVESVAYCTLDELKDSSGNQFNMTISDVTNVVKHWYVDKDNFGLMIKQATEEYINPFVPRFSSSNSLGKPCLIILYRNHNGLINYLDYFPQTFTAGTTYINTYNGNLTGVFNVGNLMKSRIPLKLNVVYNTNDVILNNNTGLGLGWRLNMFQTIKEVTIDDKTYLKYTNESGTAYYFCNKGTYFEDEDDLNMRIELDDNYYYLYDIDCNCSKFLKKQNEAYLFECINTEGYKVNFIYDTNNRITKIIDQDENKIDIVYNGNNVTFVSSDDTIVVNLLNNQITGIISCMGNTQFTYDSRKLLTEIIDIDCSKIKYDYYQAIPHRIKKVTEYGIDSGIGKYYDFNYQFDSTTLIDNNNQATTKTYNSSGVQVSCTSLKSRENIKDAYGKSYNFRSLKGYASEGKKLKNDYLPIRSVKNLINKNRFDDGIVDFIFNSEKVQLSLSDETRYISKKSLKIISEEIEQIIKKDLIVSKGKNYNLSAYLKTTTNVKLALSYLNKDNNIVRVCGNRMNNYDTFTRSDVTIYYPLDAKSPLSIEFIVDKGTSYIDAMQLEEGEVANQYNLVYNSDFKDGYTDWNVSASYHLYENYKSDTQIVLSDLFEKVMVSEEKSALKITRKPNLVMNFSKIIDISGEAGDNFTLSFWYKNKGIVSNYKSMTDCFNDYIDLEFEYDYGILSPRMPNNQSGPLTPNETEWQYFSISFVAEFDYNKFSIVLHQEMEANDFYITDICLFKNMPSVSYNYNNSGLVSARKNLSGSVEEFSYDKNNQLIKITNPIGKTLNYEYDNNVANRVLRGITDSGITNKIKYDTTGNPIYTSISRENIKEIVNGLYKIRLKGTEKYIRFKNNIIYISSDKCGHDNWYFEKNGSYYTIRYSIISNKYLTVSGNNLITSKFDNDNSMFYLTKNTNGSYMISSKSANKYLKFTENGIELSSASSDIYNFEFYIEIPNQLFIQNEATYDDESKYVTSTTDTLLNKTYYDIDSNTGLTKSIINSNGYKTEYTYDNKKQLIKIKNNKKEINYAYNNQNLLSEISNNNVNYKFIYDEFNNTKNVKIGDDITLITNNYEPNNGNLISSVYGNNQSTSYEYDEFNRIKKLTKMDNVYNYKYGNNGDLIKVIDNDNVYKYTYDDSKRLCEYQNNDFIIKYKYDINDNVLNKYYKYNNINHSIENTYNDEESILKTIFDNNTINYNYDNLGRLINKNINNNLNTNYTYITNGNRTSLLVDTIEINNNKYKYDYDKLGNIINIYNNDVLEYEYSYDEYNQLLKENNYINNTTTRYKYDNYGNILYKKIYYLNTYNQISQNKYEYKNNSFKDLLTKFNNEEILYDGIGNPTNIGSKNLTWINGRQLQSYSDSINNITYKYNKDGIRTSKIVNNVKTMYELEGNDIVFEKTNNNVIYYIRSASELIGLKYNDDIYYYIKNNQNDIIGITDSNYNIIANYKYDSFGNIISITDNEGSIITNNNHIAIINPFRYRCYYYDRETNLYYLNSRYYNPEWGRFINVDDCIGMYGMVQGYNLYMYAFNNPINYIDEEGNFALFSSIKKAFSNVAKKAKDVINKITSSVSSFATKARDAFVVDVGIGPGFKAGIGISKIMSAKVGYSKTMNYTYSNRKFEQSNNTFLGVDVNIANKDFGPKIEVNHKLHIEGENSDKHSNPVALISEIISCEHTTVNYAISAPKLEYELPSKNLFVGLNLDFFVGVGISFKIGFNIGGN